MRYVELARVQHQVQVGRALPFHVLNADLTLLLARGQLIEGESQLNHLVQRGALVDLEQTDDPPSARSQIEQVDAKQLPALLRDAIRKAIQQLDKPAPEQLAATVEAVADPLMAIAERDPDLAIFQVLRQEGNYLVQYGVNHAIHCAFTAFLAAARLGWTAGDAQRAFKAALTMNLSMFELQGELAIQTTPMTEAQRAAIDSHALRSRTMLEAAGVRDPDWLGAVARHHAPQAGSDAAGEDLAALLCRADIYTAKLSARCNREALAADVAARLMFLDFHADPAASAIVKEFGVYPPGCHVRLASGETGVVVRRGEQAHTPWVATTANAQGMALPTPRRRNTAQRPFNIAAVLRQGAANMRFGPDQLLQACA